MTHPSLEELQRKQREADEAWADMGPLWEAVSDVFRNVGHVPYPISAFVAPGVRVRIDALGRRAFLLDDVECDVIPAAVLQSFVENPGPLYRAAIDALDRSIAEAKRQREELAGGHPRQCAVHPGSLAEADRLRAALAAAEAERDRLREEMTSWCLDCWPARHGPRPPEVHPAVVRIEYSDRHGACCAEHIGELIAAWAFDHSYDRVGEPSIVHELHQAEALRMPDPPADIEARARAAIAAARAYLAELDPEWEDHTISPTREQRAELVRRCTEAARPPSVTRA